ncbi:GNAT family N-acetyltransferase [Methanobrevibacter olleyae]|uniref:GNAT family acetyltransferase n=1 Tax=Methanobrevibacter olleyae TaxID=294671 RepID=A0A126QX41_METOL|nr:GNAT family N-acetyltransferase [Methanobrevibacter olleyae]AMK14733.1 GNAT family acetyltransferase [Methanobrevibacter olleyae]
MILKTKRLILRPWIESDAESLYHFAKNPKIGPIAGWPVHKSVEDSLEIIKTVLSKKETYAITINNKAIGSIGLLFYPDTNHHWEGEGAELGYWIGEEYWGQGLAVEASNRLIKHAFEDLNINKIYAGFRYDNHQSKRVLEKLGFKYYRDLKNIDFSGKEIYEVSMVLEKNK